MAIRAASWVVRKRWQAAVTSKWAMRPMPRPPALDRCVPTGGLSPLLVGGYLYCASGAIRIVLSHNRGGVSRAIIASP